MVLIDSIKKSFFCVIENPAITLILVLFLIVSNMLTPYIIAAKTPIFALILLLCLSAIIFIFFSGWLKVIKESVDRDKIKDKNYYSIFLEGVGENFISIAISTVIYTFFTFITIILAHYLTIRIFGDINFFLNDLNAHAIDYNNFKEYINSLNDTQKDIIYGWNFCIMSAMSIFTFVFLFYFPSILYNKKNIFLKPIIAIWENLKFLFKNFFPALGLGIFIYILHLFLAVLNAIFSNNAILSVIFLLIYIYFISYVVMLIFNYYEAKNSSSDRCNSIRENETGNNAGKED